MTHVPEMNIDIPRLYLGYFHSTGRLINRWVKVALADSREVIQYFCITRRSIFLCANSNWTICLTIIWRYQPAAAYRIRALIAPLYNVFSVRLERPQFARENLVRLARLELMRLITDYSDLCMHTAHLTLYQTFRFFMPRI